MLGMIDNSVKEVKVIGRWEMNLDPHIDRLLTKMLEYDSNSISLGRTKPFFNDAKELFKV